MATTLKRRKQSAPRKRSMTKADICNVEPVSSTELFEATKLLAVAWAGKAEDLDSQRWTITGKAVK